MNWDWCASKMQWRHSEQCLGLVSERNQEIFSLSTGFGNEPKVSVIWSRCDGNYASKINKTGKLWVKSYMQYACTGSVKVCRHKEMALSCKSGITLTWTLWRVKNSFEAISASAMYLSSLPLSTQFLLSHNAGSLGNTVQNAIRLTHLSHSWDFCKATRHTASHFQFRNMDAAHTVEIHLCFCQYWQ
jgi:hypothetical protein